MIDVKTPNHQINVRSTCVLDALAPGGVVDLQKFNECMDCWRRFSIPHILVMMMIKVMTMVKVKTMQHYVDLLQFYDWMEGI